MKGHCLVNTVLLHYWLTVLNILSLSGISIQRQTHDWNLLLLHLGTFTINLCTPLFLGGGGEIMGDFLLTPVFVTRVSAENAHVWHWCVWWRKSSLDASLYQSFFCSTTSFTPCVLPTNSATTGIPRTAWSIRSNSVSSNIEFWNQLWCHLVVRILL